MRRSPKLNYILWTACLLCVACPAVAADLVIQNQTVSDTRTFDSPEATILDHVVLTAAAVVTVHSTYEVVLKPGTRIAKGARFTARMRDVDGLPNRWEQASCNTLAHGPGDDPDNDGLPMQGEYANGTAACTADTDGDGMPDGWEVQHGFNPLANDAAADADGDGLSNLEEYRAGTDPRNADTDGDGMPDGWEVRHGLNPNKADADGDLDNDGVSNWLEYRYGTDPSSAQDKPLYFKFQYDSNGNLQEMKRPSGQ